MSDYRTIDDYTASYFVEHPQEIDAFIRESFQQYAEDGDSAILLMQLRIVARAKGLSAIAQDVGITRQGLQKALSPNGNPRFNNINATMHAMGYCLMPQPV